MLKNVYNVEVCGISYEKISAIEVEELTGYSQQYISKAYSSGRKVFDKKEVLKRHGRSRKIKTHWAAFDTETCYKVEDDEVKEYRIWSYQIGFCEKDLEDFVLINKCLKKINVKFYTFETCFLFDNEIDFLNALNEMFNLGLRTLMVHNLKYDATWLANIFKNTLSSNHDEVKEPHTSFILHNGRLYNGHFYLGDFNKDGHHKYLTFVDTYKTFASSLGRLTKAYKCKHSKITVTNEFYKDFRKSDYVFTDLDLLYNSYDVIGLCELLYAFDNAIVDLTSISVFKMKNGYVTLRTAAGLAYKVLEESVKEYSCIKCQNKCQHYKPTKKLCENANERRYCSKYVNAFNVHFPKTRLQSDLLKNVLKSMSKGKALFLEYPQLENVIDSSIYGTERFSYGVNDFELGMEALIAYAFDSYKGGVTMAIPQRAGYIHRNVNFFDDLKYSSKNNYVYVRNDYQKPFGWVEDYTSLYPSRMRLTVPAMKASYFSKKEIEKRFFEIPERTARQLYCLREDANVDFYVNQLDMFLHCNEDCQIKPANYNNFIYCYKIYYLDNILFKSNKCKAFHSKMQYDLQNKYFIVKAKIRFDAPFYFFQISPRNLSEEQLKKWNGCKGEHKKGIGFRAYQKNSMIGNLLESIEVKIALDELLFYRDIVKFYGGFFEFEIIDGVGCDILDNSENPLAYYIDTLGDLKAQSTGVLREIIKLLLNSAYGKLGTKAVGIDKSLTEPVYKFNEEFFTKIEAQTSDDFIELSTFVNFVPAATAITSHGRMHLFAPNIDEFYYCLHDYNIISEKTGGFIQGQITGTVDYCDTDSMYVINRLGWNSESEMRDFFGMVGNGNKMGEFKCEDELVMFKALGAKRKQYLTKTKYRNIFKNHTTLAGVSGTLKFNDFSTIKNIKTKKSKIDKNTKVTLIYDSDFNITIKDSEILMNEELIIENECLNIREGLNG